MKLALMSLLVTLCFGSVTLAQPELDAKTKKLLEQAAKNARAVTSEITVNESVHVQAVLIPRVDSERIFGREIANNYVVIQLSVGNKSPSAALIIHGIFIDYHDWPLSGVPPSDFLRRSNTDKYQAASIPSQVASEEYRVVRGQLLDAQAHTFRNQFLRWLTLAGNLAGAFTFSLNEEGIIKGIAAATGVGIPGLATAWPDRTVEQLNRVSDLGFRANKLVPKESSEIIVCFFPIDRFLTPGFKKLFLKSPALFFAPLSMLVDPAIESDARALVGDLVRGTGMTFDELKAAMPCYMNVRHPQVDRIGYDVCLAQMGLEVFKDPTTNKETLKAFIAKDDKGKIKLNNEGKPQPDRGFYKFLALEFIGNVSLNRATINVDGTMAVDVKAVAAGIDEVVIDQAKDCGDAGDECLWTNTDIAGGVRTGIIRGAYLKGGQVKIAEAEKLTITDLTTIEGSNDNELRFSFKLNAPVPNQTKLHFTVEKPAGVPDAKPLVSNTWEQVVAFSPSATAISSVIVDNIPTPANLTVKGKGFKVTPLIVSLLPQAGDPVTVTPTAVTDTSFDVVLPTGADKLHAGCWQVQVKAGKLTSNQSEMFAIPPDPELDSAQRNNEFIYLKGKDLVDFSSCGGQQLSFKLLRTDDTEMTDLKVVNWGNGAPVLELPDKAKQGDWKVRVVKGTQQSEKPLTVRP
ncbi:MAG TPA: hypothetical protein VN844_06800 [Pyrinomonadaceae bacterium]|nr:hypothetical protein [Pyrinomonadaceae bacterium]